jgi:hypothetical protein
MVIRKAEIIPLRLLIVPLVDQNRSGKRGNRRCLPDRCGIRNSLGPEVTVPEMGSLEHSVDEVD